MIILYDNVPASALDKVVNFAGEVLLERTHPTLPSRRRLLAKQLTRAHQANLKNLIYITRAKQEGFSFPGC